MKKTGFTLIEFIIVLLIIGLLVSIGALQYDLSIEDSKKVTFKSAVLNALSAAESYRQKYGEYPSTATLNLLFNDTAYFTTKPINPYTSQPLQATTNRSPDASSKLGYFYYNVKSDGSIEVITNPVVDINLASGSLAGGSLPRYTVTFTVKNTSGSAISEAQITIGGRTASTNTSGIASVTLPQSSYFYSVNKDGYNFYTGNINLTGNTPVTVTLSPKTYTVTIFVMDANTGNPISGATVSGIGSGGTTDPNGKLTLTNIVAQNYTASVSAVGYTATTKAITVSNNQQVNITLSRASCTITFDITNGAEALVQLSDGSTVNLNSSGSGSVSKPCGEYDYTISKDGYSALSGGIKALSNVTIRGTMTAISSSGGGQGADIVEIAVAYTYNPEYFNNIQGNPNRGIVVRPITNGTDQITLLGIATAAFDYAVGFRPTTIQVLAIGAGGDNIGDAAGGSGYYGWAQFTTIPDVNETLTINVNVGMTVSGGNGQSTTVSIPSYVPTITATGGGNGNNPYGQNPGSFRSAGVGFGTTSSSSYKNGTPAEYIRPESLQIWRDLAYTQFVALGFGGGGLVHTHYYGGGSYSSWNIVKQPGVVFLFIRGVVYY